MNLHDNFERKLDIISTFNGVCLNVEEKIKLEIALNELHHKEKMEELLFWGKLYGEENDYFIACGMNYTGFYEYPEKKLFYAVSNNFNFVPLKTTYEYHDKDFLDSYCKPLKGIPEFILKQYQEPEDPNADPVDPVDPVDPPVDGVDQTNNLPNPLDPDASVDDNAPKVEPKKENFTEALKLAYLVNAIDYDTCVIPHGAVKLIPDHELRRNENFKGLSREEVGNLKMFQHFRPITKRDIVEADDAIFRYDYFDSLADDKVKGSWSIQLDSTKNTCNIRSLLWPGYFAFHKAGTNLYGGYYFGNGMKNAELPFMI